VLYERDDEVGKEMMLLLGMLTIHLNTYVPFRCRSNRGWCNRGIQLQPTHEDRSLGRLPQMGVRFVMIELCRTVLTRCNLEEGRSDVEERDLTKLVERSVSREREKIL
jgi:hypothetical protein